MPSQYSFVPSWAASIFIILCLSLVLYAIYQRLFHPLSGYPGPIIPSLTNLWKSYHIYNLVLHEKLVELHMRYGPVVRVGPNDLHFWSADAIAPIYKGGRMMGKTEFYDAFTTFNPNLFGTRDEDAHALRRRQLAHGFSQASIEKMEPIIDEQLQILISKLMEYSKKNEVFDLKACISCYVLDILGEVAFSKSFDSQTSGKADAIPAINDHILMACVIGQLPFQALSKALIARSPIPRLRRLIKSRAQLKSICAERVHHRINNPSNRHDLLQNLIEAKDPETGAQLTELDINTEAFAMLVAGSHTSSGTMTFLFWHLLHHPDILRKVVKEINETCRPLGPDQISHPIGGLESTLQYTMACVRENFRMNPVFTMNLWRRVNYKEGAVIAGYHVPYAANVSISNYALHHNPDIWGSSHDRFNPERWRDADSKEKLRNLLPFSTGHRMCIGKNLAMTNILKTVTTLLTKFDFEPLSRSQTVQFRSSGIGEMEGPFLCRVNFKEQQ